MGEFCEPHLNLVYFCQRIGEKLLKSSKMTQIIAVIDSNDMFFSMNLPSEIVEKYLAEFSMIS